MPSSIKGTLGNYPTNLTCDYSIQNFDDIIGIGISKENTTYGSIIDLVYFRPKREPLFNNGSYLLNRTIIKGITEMSPIPAITFTLLECSDEGVYHCRFKYYTSSGEKDEEGNTSLNITNYSLRITKMPDQTKYTEGTSIQLTCFSLDYPSGIYRWLLPDTSVFNGSLYTRYNAKKSQSGVYTCLLIFKFTMEPSIQFITEELLIGVPETTSFQCATSSNVTAIIGSVSGTLGLWLGIFGVFYLWRRSKLKMSGSDHGRQMTTITTDYASNNYEGMGEDNTVHHYDDLRIRQEQQYYNTPVKTRR